MSIKLMNQVWETSKHEGSTLLILLALADHANDEGLCWPSIGRLARRGRVGERHAMRILAGLEASGDVVVIERGGGKGRSNLYRVTPVSGFEEADTPRDTVTPTTGFRSQTLTPASAKGDMQVPKGDIAGAKGDSAMSQEPPVKNLHLKTPGSEGGDLRIETPGFPPSAEADRTWRAALGILYEELPRATFDTWVRDTELVGASADELTIAVANAYGRDWLEERVTPMAERAVAKIVGRPIRVRFVIVQDESVDRRVAAVAARRR